MNRIKTEPIKKDVSQNMFSAGIGKSFNMQMPII